MVRGNIGIGNDRALGGDTKVLGNEVGGTRAQLRPDQHIVGATSQCDPHADQGSGLPEAAFGRLTPGCFPLACAGQLVCSFHAGSSLRGDGSAPEVTGCRGRACTAKASMISNTMTSWGRSRLSTVMSAVA